MRYDGPPQSSVLEPVLISSSALKLLNVIMGCRPTRCDSSGLCVPGGLQERRRGHSGQEDSAGGAAVSPAAGCPTGPAGMPAGPGTGTQRR